MVIIYNYTVVRVNNQINCYRIHAKGIVRCPNCNSLMSGYDTRKRKVLTSDGTKNIFLLRRLRCQVCNSYHLEVPDFIVPYKHYTQDTIAAVINGDESSCPADDSTIRRWKKNHPPTLPVNDISTVVSFLYQDTTEGEVE